MCCYGFLNTVDKENSIVKCFTDKWKYRWMCCYGYSNMDAKRKVQMNHELHILASNFISTDWIYIIYSLCPFGTMYLSNSVQWFQRLPCVYKQTYKICSLSLYISID